MYVNTGVLLCCVLICYVNKTDISVQPAGYHSCQIKSSGSASFRRSDTRAILIGDIMTTNHSLVLEINERVTGWIVVSWKIWCSGFTNYPRHFCQCMLFMLCQFQETN